MQTANKNVFTAGAEGKQRRLTITSEKLQKLRHKNDDNAAGITSQNRNIDGQESESARARRTAVNNERFLQAFKKIDAAQRISKAMSVAATNKDYILNLLQDKNSGDTGVCKMPFQKPLHLELLIVSFIFWIRLVNSANFDCNNAEITANSLAQFCVRPPIG